jgi:hypothetical protein
MRNVLRMRNRMKMRMNRRMRNGKRLKLRSAGVGALFNGFGAYMGGRSKGSMETYYNGRSQRNKSALILMKSFADALYYWN